MGICDIITDCNVINVEATSYGFTIAARRLSLRGMEEQQGQPTKKPRKRGDLTISWSAEERSGLERAASWKGLKPGPFVKMAVREIIDRLTMERKEQGLPLD